VGESPCVSCNVREFFSRSKKDIFSKKTLYNREKKKKCVYIYIYIYIYI